MKEKNKIYTATNFANYHAGTMPAAEMHQLEKAALEDPFLADALDGFVYSQKMESDIAELRARLNEKKTKKNIFPLSVTQNMWWRIAALFIVITGGGYLFYKINYNNKESSLAKIEMPSKNVQTDSFGLTQKDSATIKNNVALENQQASAFAQKDKNSLPEDKSPEEKKVLNDQAKNEPVLAERKNDSVYGRKNFKKDYYAQAPAQYILKGKVTDEEGKPVAFATVKDNNRNKAVVTDTAGKFLLQSPDSNTTATVSVVGYATKKVALQKDEQPTIAMNKSSAELDEVATRPISSGNKSLENSKGLSGKVAGVQVTKSQNPSIISSDNFNEYLEKNMTPVYDENNEQVSGEVLLSFLLNKKGKPQNIKVVKSSCTPCEAGAIKLLQNGPDWAGKKNQRATVSIKFK